jgi:hypothetical protein
LSVYHIAQLSLKFLEVPVFTNTFLSGKSSEEFIGNHPSLKYLFVKILDTISVYLVSAI